MTGTSQPLERRVRNGGEAGPSETWYVCDSSRGVSRLTRVILYCTDQIGFEVPIGYQDEKGFHYGPGPVRRFVDWPVFD